MKKLLSVVLSFFMIMTCLIPAFAAEKTAEPASAPASYDKAAVANGDVASLSYEQKAAVLLDWLDDKIAKAAEDFNAFTASVGVDLSITGVDSLVAMKDYLQELGGDFAALDPAAIVDRTGGDLNFIYGIFQFVADNADVFAKVFRWDNTEGARQTFDYGKVGEYIEALPEDDAIRSFYDTYLKDGWDIRHAFVTEIAREMDYAWDGAENFDDVLNKGIKAKFLEIFGALLSDESRAAFDAFDLRTTDVYTLVKNFIGLLQNDYKAELDEVLWAMLQALQGAVSVVKDAVNLEPPTVTIGDKTQVVGTYTPTSTDPDSYLPVIYTSSMYKEAIDAALGDDSPVTVTDEALPENVSAMVSGAGTDLDKAFVMTVKQGEEVLQNIVLDFADIEAMAKAAATEMGNTMAAGMGATVNSVDVQFGYKAYATAQDYAMQVSVKKASANVTVTIPGINITTTQDIDVSSAIQNPVATIVVENLSGSIDGLDEIQALIDFVDTEAVYDDALLDVMTPYDDYKGAVGQINRILCDAVKMITTDAAYAELALTEGGNENLYANLEKICAKVSGMLDMVKTYIPREDFIALADAADIGAAFTSSHGFNAGMIYDMDFSDVENALVCGIRMGCDLLVEDDPESILYQLHLRVEDLETLDAMAVAAADLLLGKVMEQVDIGYTYVPMDYANVAEDGAKDVIMDKAVDILYYAANYAVGLVNDTLNELIADVNAKLGLKIGAVAFELGVEKNRSWSVTLNALTDRFIELADGVMIAAGQSAKGNKNVWSKLTILANAAIPMQCMFSNYTGLAAVNEAFFDKALDGDLGDFLALFEVKTENIASDVPVTMALINASEHIVDGFFPDTVNREDYAPSLTVQQEFTGAANDAVIARNNMKSLNNRKTHVVPAVLDLIVESGLLPTFACSHDNTEAVAAVAATCVAAGSTAGERCLDCGALIGVETTPVDASNHAGPTENVAAVAATCTAAGSTAGVKCAACGKWITAPAATEKLAHADADGNGYCDNCGADLGGHEEEENGKTGFAAFWQRFIDFFKKIADFFKKLFGR